MVFESFVIKVVRFFSASRKGCGLRRREANKIGGKKVEPWLWVKHRVGHLGKDGSQTKEGLRVAGVPSTSRQS